MPKTKHKAGDTVYVRTPALKVIKASIKKVHIKPELTYELDMKAKNRFYPADAVFETMDACIENAKAERMKSLEDLMMSRTKSSGENMLEPVGNGEWMTTTGEVIGPDFELSDEDSKELDELVCKLQLFCMKRYIPFCLLVGLSRHGEEMTAHRCAYFPGPRTMMFIRQAWDAAQKCIHYMIG